MPGNPSDRRCQDRHSRADSYADTCRILRTRALPAAAPRRYAPQPDLGRTERIQLQHVESGREVFVETEERVDSCDGKKSPAHRRVPELLEQGPSPVQRQVADELAQVALVE